MKSLPKTINVWALLASELGRHIIWLNFYLEKTIHSQSSWNISSVLLGEKFDQDSKFLLNNQNISD